MATVGSLIVDLQARTAQFDRAMKSASARVRRFTRRVQRNVDMLARYGTRMAIVAGGAIAGSVAEYARAGDALAKMARRTGVSVEALSALRFAASQSGTDIASLENVLRRMQRSIYDAGRGLSTATDALADLGLTYRTINELSPEAQFKLLAEQLSHIDDATQRAAIAMTLFGRSGTSVLPMIAQGAAGIERLEAEAQKLGLTFGVAAARQAEHLTDAMDRMTRTVRKVGFEIGAKLAPYIEAIVTGIAAAATKTIEWVQANQQTVTWLARVAMGVVSFVVVLKTLSVALAAVNALLSVASGGLTAIATVLGALAVSGAGAWAINRQFAGFASEVAKAAEQIERVDTGLDKLRNGQGLTEQLRVPTQGREAFLKRIAELQQHTRKAVDVDDMSPAIRQLLSDAADRPRGGAGLQLQRLPEPRWANQSSRFLQNLPGSQGPTEKLQQLLTTSERSATAQEKMETLLQSIKQRLGITVSI